MTPLLRSPPWPGVAARVAAVSAPDPGRPVDPAALGPLVARVRAARVAGSFWCDDPAQTPAEVALVAAIERHDLAAPGLADSLLAVRYRDPFTGAETTPEATVALLALWRDLILANRPIRAAAGIAWWKRETIRRFLWSGRPISFVPAQAAGPGTAVWPSRAWLAEPAARIEDGFIRSVGLGADLHPPFSVVVDRTGIYFDPAAPSDLETILQTAAFTPDLLDRAEAIRARVVAGGISKYGVHVVEAAPPPRDLRRTLLVPGQVEDDQSVRAGGAGVAGNVDLLARVRAAEPDAWIVYKPHPDVDAGHRRGWASDAAILSHADEIARGEPMPRLLARVDAVHVLTSLTGFEALLRGLPVTTHGQPFFAGWGLTTDLGPPLPRRTRRLRLAELVAGVLILYPRYMDPLTGLPCPPEILLGRLADGVRPARSWLVRARQAQGRVMARVRRRGA